MSDIIILALVGYILAGGLGAVAAPLIYFIILIVKGWIHV